MSELHKLAKCLDASAPDLAFRNAVRRERKQIKEALETVGQYVIQVGDLIYIIERPLSDAIHQESKNPALDSFLKRQDEILRIAGKR